MLGDVSIFVVGKDEYDELACKLILLPLVFVGKLFLKAPDLGISNLCCIKTWEVIPMFY